MPPKEIKIVHKFDSLESYKAALKKAPQPTWLKTRDLGQGNKSTYLPLPYQQAIADEVFREFNVIDEKYTVIANEILCTVKIQLLPDYPNAEHQIITGVGSKPIQMNAGGKAETFPLGKKLNALEYCAPAARAAAISNALNTLGNLFGRNLARAVDNGFNKSQKTESKK